MDNVQNVVAVLVLAILLYQQILILLGVGWREPNSTLALGGWINTLRYNLKNLQILMMVY
jgi:hypothetical protein